MTGSTGRATCGVTPNRRGARSREAVLDAAERLIAEHGYKAVTVAALVEEAGVPASSIYHYFDSKQGVVLAAMERGAERFFAKLPVADGRAGAELDRLRALLDGVAATLEHQPDFPRILVVMAAQPAGAWLGEIHRVGDRVHELALQRLRGRCTSRSRSTPRARTPITSRASRSPCSPGPSSPTSRTQRSRCATCSSTCPPRSSPSAVSSGRPR